QDPSVDITKKFVYVPSREDGVALADETIVYTITASNVGNVDLSELTMTDERFLDSKVPSELSAGSTFYCYPTTAITQADVDAGVVSSNVTIKANAPSGVPVTNMAAASTTLVRLSGLTLIVSTTLEDGDGETGTSPGDFIKHRMTITNEGTVTLFDISVDDSMLSLADDR
ncbi:unnamed protein product, partial [Hapterophycus canaliculatus]